MIIRSSLSFTKHQIIFSRFASTHKVVGTFGETTQVLPEDRKFVYNEKIKDIAGHSSNKPVVILFGWAGASVKNLSKYGQVYRDYGCPTIEYILPTRFIFRHSEQAFEAVEDVFSEVEKHKNRKTIVHCLSDTGVLTFQGLTIAAEVKDKDFKPSGIVWDSCLGPRPKVTIPRTMILTAINWLSRMRDGMTLAEAVRSSATDFRDLGWRNFLRRLKGLEAKISCMNDIWAGYWARDLKTNAHELLIYSKTDLYVPSTYIDTEMVPSRLKLA